MRLLFISLLGFILQTANAQWNWYDRALGIHPIVQNFYQYETWKTYGDSPSVTYQANGMYVVADEGIIVFDGPWDTTQYQPFMDSIKAKHNKPVIFCLATHSHEDRTGALDFFKSQGVKTYTSKYTRELSIKNHEQLSEFVFEGDTQFTISPYTFQVIFPGAGHTPDNLVVWFEKQKILYGGCFVKSVDATDLGNIADADIGAWPNSIKRVQKMCNNPKVIMPGHGYWNSVKSLKHTRKLIKEHKNKNHIFFLHNAYLEYNNLNAEHPEYGRVEYRKILQDLGGNGNVIMSEIRPANTSAVQYATKITKQIMELIWAGVPPDHITVIGTSKGGYIAQYVSSRLANPNVNFVFIGCFNESDLTEMPDIQFCGNILNIYEETDSFGTSAISRLNQTHLKVSHFKEIALNTGLRHGFLYKSLPDWIEPSLMWANRNYKMK